MAPGKVAAPKRNPRAWDALTPPLTEWILDAVSTMGFKQMTPVQAATMPHFMGNKDVVVEVCSGMKHQINKTDRNRLSPAAAKHSPSCSLLFRSSSA